MHRALVRDLQQPPTLLLVERAEQLYLALDPVEPRRLRLARVAVGGVHPRVAQSDRDCFEWPLLTARIHAYRHRRTGAQSGEQEVVGVGTHVGPACRDRLVAEEPVAPRDDLLHEARGATADHHRGSLRGLVAVSPFG